jgi:transcriptional regulator with XRE-family HTH domain
VVLLDKMLDRILTLIGNRHGAKKELADYLGIPQAVITDWIKGRVKSYSKYAPQIAEYYGVTLDNLAGKTDDPGENKKTVTDKGDGLSIERQKLFDLLVNLPPEKVPEAESYLRWLIDSQKQL